jgi:hypothetical protein
MHRNRRRELTLAGAAVLLIAIAWWSMQRGTAQPAGAAASDGTPSAARAQARPENPVTDVDLNALEAERPEPEESTRNPFRFKPKPAPPVPAAVIGQQQAAAAAAAQAPAGPPPPPRIPLKYIGDVSDPKNPGRKIAVLSDSRGTYYGREGEVVEGRYQILRIGVESIELAYLDGRGRQTIRQTGQ